MSFLTALRKKWHYSVENPGAGRLVYREGNREYTFPIYEEDGVLVLVGVPSVQRVHFFFNWYGQPGDFPPVAAARILPRIAEHLEANGIPVRIWSGADEAERSFKFHPELFESRGLAGELLEAAGYTCFCDYSSIDPVHEEFGLEISGIPNETAAKRILAALQRGFPHWHHAHVCVHEHGREPGWSVMICMFPSEACASGSYDES